MTTETTVRQTLQQAATTIPTGDTQLEHLVRRGRHRRNRNRGTVVAAVAALAVAVGLNGSALDLPGATPFATQTPAEHADVAIFLCSDPPIDTGAAQRCESPATDEQIRQIRAALALDEAVAEVRFETQQQAYERFSEMFADQPELVESVTPDTLPASLRITLVDGAPIDEIVNHYSNFDGAEAVIAPERD